MSNMKIDGFEMCKAQNGQALEFQEGLNIVVFLDSLLERKSLRPLDCLLNWKEHEIIYASMLVFDGNTKIYQAQSISDSSLEKMLIYLSKIWAKKFQKKCEKKFDKR